MTEETREEEEKYHDPITTVYDRARFAFISHAFESVTMEMYKFTFCFRLIVETLFCKFIRKIMNTKLCKQMFEANGSIDEKLQTLVRIEEPIEKRDRDIEINVKRSV